VSRAAAALLALLLVPAAFASAASAPSGGGDAQALAKSLADPALPAAERARTLRALQSVRDPGQIPALFELARSSATEAGAAQAAWSALVDTALESPAAARPRLPGWLDSADPDTRLRALSLMREGVWDGAMTPRVRKLLLKDADEDVRAEAAGALGANEVTAAKPDLLKAAKDKSAPVREAAAEALAALENAEAD
jgi:hypothetical protein